MTSLDHRAWLSRLRRHVIHLLLLRRETLTGGLEGFRLGGGRPRSGGLSGGRVRRTAGSERHRRRNKGCHFDAVGADLLQRGGFDRMLRASAHPDTREALRGAIHAIVEMYAASVDVLRVLASTAPLDAAAVGGAVGGAVQRMELGRATGMAELAQRPPYWA